MSPRRDVCGVDVLLFFKQRTAYELPVCLEFRRVLFRSLAQIASVVQGRGPRRPWTTEAFGVSQAQRGPARAPASTLNPLGGHSSPESCTTQASAAPLSDH